MNQFTHECLICMVLNKICFHTQARSISSGFTEVPFKVGSTGKDDTLKLLLLPIIRVYTRKCAVNIVEKYEVAG